MKRIIKYVSEITLAIILMFISYFAWDRIDVEAYEKMITQYTLEDIAISIDGNFNQLEYMSNENGINSSVLSVNNYQDRKYNANIFLELNGVNKNVVDNLILVVDNNQYNLKDIYSYTENSKHYFLISNITLVEYEKKTFNLKLLVNDNFEINEETAFSYNIIEEII